MLALKPNCENCGKALPNHGNDAMICTFECTFCADCVRGVLDNVCPNCGGGFEKRPTRPSSLLVKYPTSVVNYLNPIDKEKFEIILLKYKNIDPRNR